MRRSSKKEKRRQRNNLIVGLLMVFLMVFSILAFSIDSSFRGQGDFEFNNFVFNEKIIFDDQIFNQDIRKYYTKINGEEIQFFFTPDMMSRVNVSANNLDSIRTASSVYFSRAPLSDDYEFNNELLFFDILKIEFAKNSFIYSKQGLKSHNVFESDLEVITCNDASEDSLVFMLGVESTALPTIKETEDYCFEVSGDSDNLLFVSDYLLYKIHRVI